MEHDRGEALLAATAVLDALYSKDHTVLKSLIANLRIFAETDEERDMMPDELARAVIERGRVRASPKAKIRRAAAGAE
jgi:hypothetical protein